MGAGERRNSMDFTAATPEERRDQLASRCLRSLDARHPGAMHTREERPGRALQAAASRTAADLR